MAAKKEKKSKVKIANKNKNKNSINIVINSHNKKRSNPSAPRQHAPSSIVVLNPGVPYLPQDSSLHHIYPLIQSLHEKVAAQTQPTPTLSPIRNTSPFQSTVSSLVQPRYIYNAPIYNRKQNPSPIRSVNSNSPPPSLASSQHSHNYFAPPPSLVSSQHSHSSSIPYDTKDMSYFQSVAQIKRDLSHNLKDNASLPPVTVSPMKDNFPIENHPNVAIRTKAPRYVNSQGDSVHRFSDSRSTGNTSVYTNDHFDPFDSQNSDKVKEAMKKIAVLEKPVFNHPYFGSGSSSSSLSEPKKKRVIHKKHTSV